MIIRSFFKNWPILLRLNFKKIEDDKLRSAFKQQVIIEWKEAARRLEFIFFLLSFTTICTTPIVLFSKFYFLDLGANDNSLKCDY